MSFPAYESYRDSGNIRLKAVPSAWSVLPLKRVAALVYGDALATDIRNHDGEITVFGSNGPVGVHDEANTKAPAILIGRKGSCGALNWSDTPSFAIDTVYFVDEEHTSADLRWLFWALHPLGLSEVSQDTGVPGLSRETAYESVLALPSPFEQRTIAAFLDRETAKIDALVEAQERLIALLKEKRQAVISHAVTKGLDPSAPMKDSGVEWLGQVPAHWEVKQIKHLVADGTSITYGMVQAGPHFEGGVPYIRTGDMSGSELPLDGYPLASPEVESAYIRSRVRPGDLVIAIRATVGKCLPVPDGLELANLTQGTAKISPGPAIARDFLHFAIGAPGSQAYFDQMAKGATFREITLDALRRLPVAVPPHDEQFEITEHLKMLTGVFDVLSSAAESAITLLQERRTALISAAVTGKIDVRGLVQTAEAA